MSVVNEECLELKNIKYKTMLLSGVPSSTEIRNSNSLLNLDKFLEDDKTNNQNEPWNKLDNTTKTKKMLTFAENYSKEKEFSEQEQALLIAFLKDCLERKKLQRVKEVEYNKETGEIKDIPALHFNKPSKHFTLKNCDKRVSTLKSLPPKKVRGTVKNSHNKVNVVDSDDSEQELDSKQMVQIADEVKEEVKQEVKEEVKVVVKEKQVKPRKKKVIIEAV